MVLFGVEIRSHLQANCPLTKKWKLYYLNFFAFILIPCLCFTSAITENLCSNLQFRIKSCFQRFRITISDYQQQQQQQQAVSRRNSSSSSSTQSKPSLAAPPTQAPTARPPTPPSTYGGGTGTLRKASSSPYRTPAPPVSPPVAPSNYAPNYPIQAPSPSSSMSSLRKTGYATGNMASVGQPQPTAQIMRSVSGVSVQSQVYDRDSMQPYISGYWI